MATINDLIGKFQYVTQDEGVRWTQSEALGWLNEAYQQIVILRPDAGATSAVVTLAEGYRQRLDDADSINLPDAHMILDVTATAGKRPRSVRQSQLAVIDGLMPDWRRGRPTAQLERWVFDDRNPREFVVYPPAATGTQVEIVYSQAPEPHDPAANNVLDEAIKMPSAYEPAILDYLLYRAYSKDADSQANANRATAHYQAFATGIGGKSKSDTQASPSNQPG